MFEGTKVVSARVGWVGGWGDSGADREEEGQPFPTRAGHCFSEAWRAEEKKGKG